MPLACTVTAGMAGEWLCKRLNGLLLPQNKTVRPTHRVAIRSVRVGDEEARSHCSQELGAVPLGKHASKGR